MRVLQIISSLNPRFGGPPEGARQICRAFRKLGLAADLATLDGPDASWGDDCSPLRLGPQRLGAWCYADRLLDWLRANARQYDAVIVHGLWQYHGFTTWRVLEGTGKPYYVFPHGMLDPWFKHEYPLRHFKKCLYWPWAEYRVLRDARAVLFTAEEERQQARQSFAPYRVNEAVVGYGITEPGCDPLTARSAFLERFPELRDKRLVLFMGRLHPKKGCDLLIEAFATVAHADRTLQLVMAGPGQGGYRDELQARLNELELTARVTWTGMLTGNEKWGAYYSAEAFALPSHQENFGIVVAEALACGVPVLISNRVNIWREIATEKSGFVGDDTLEGTTQMLKGWIALGRSEREQMSVNGLACFRKHFHVDATVQNLLTTIEGHPCRPPRTRAA